MCDPITSLIGVAGSVLMGMMGKQKTSTPPAAAIAPVAQPITNTEAPTIKSGAGATVDDINARTTAKIGVTRTAGTAIGGLGRSGMSLDL